MSYDQVKPYLLDEVTYEGLLNRVVDYCRSYPNGDYCIIQFLYIKTHTKMFQKGCQNILIVNIGGVLRLNTLVIIGFALNT